MQRLFAALESQVFDVLVVGGGITGAGIARDAAIRGLTVAIVDKSDWASGTSSKSSRLIHGGIRYLERGEIGLVRESVRERETLLRIAPHLVKPLEFVWPVYRGARLPKWKLRAGLTIYDLLARKGGVRRHHALTIDQILEHEPMLRSDGLKGGASYFDAATDDAGLTRANVKSAVDHGAVAIDHAKAEGAVVRDMLTGESIRVQARSIVSATGPWQARGTKGSHIVVAQSRLGNMSAVTMTSPDDGRVMFVLPSGDRTIIGTTDLRTDESPDDVRISDEEVRYLLRAANVYFPQARLTTDDIVDSWSGIRPLAADPADTSPSSISREHRISRDSTGTVIVTGGKLTTYRSMAEEVVDLLEKILGQKHVECSTHVLPLP